MAIPKLLEPGKIGSMIETVHNTSAQFALLLHEAVFQCALHCQKHGDYTLIARLLGGKIKNKKGDVVETFPVAMKAVSRREIAMWLGRYTPLRLRDDVWMLAKGEKATWDLVEGYANPWHSMPEVEADRNRPVNFDNIQAIIFGTRKRFEKAVAEGKFKGDPVAMRTYLDAVEKVPVPKQLQRRVIEPDYQKHDEVEVKLILAGKTPKAEAQPEASEKPQAA